MSVFEPISSSSKQATDVLLSSENLQLVKLNLEPDRGQKDHHHDLAMRSDPSTLLGAVETTAPGCDNEMAESVQFFKHRHGGERDVRHQDVVEAHGSSSMVPIVPPLPHLRLGSRFGSSDKYYSHRKVQ